MPNSEVCSSLGLCVGFFWEEWRSQAEVYSFSLKLLILTDQTSTEELKENFCSSIFML